MALSRSWRPPQAGIARRNISEAERWALAIAGAALAAWALQRRTRDAWVLGALSGALLYRAGSAHCPVSRRFCRRSWPASFTTSRLQAGTRELGAGASGSP